MDLKDLAPNIREILLRSDLKSITAKRVRKELEKVLGYSLSNLKTQVDGIIVSQFSQIHEQLTKQPGSDPSSDTNPSSANFQQYGSPQGTPITQQTQNVLNSSQTQQQTSLPVQPQVQPPPEQKRRGRPPKSATSITTTTKTVTTKKKKKVKKPVDPNKPKRQTGLNKPLKLSPDLAAFFSRTYMPRTEVVKGLWRHIKSSNLQDPVDKRYILTDDKLKTLFGTDRLYMYTMNKQLNDHLIKLEPEEVADAEAEIALHNPIPSTVSQSEELPEEFQDAP
ncbi:hypothetical protein BB558_006820 [Smittium angustum]|nr:hypothetical protein BB558_006820 [Smittium angustum]